MPPQTPKLPPVTGARAFIVDMAPTRRSPYQKGLGSDEKEIEGAYPRRVSCALYTVPYATADGAHCKGTSKVIEDYPWAGMVVSSVLNEKWLITRGLLCGPRETWKIVSLEH